MLKSPEFRTSELRDITSLKRTLSLSAEQLADGLFGAFEACFKQHMMWTSTDKLEVRPMGELSFVRLMMMMMMGIRIAMHPDHTHHYHSNPILHSF
jgi:hypothetical protein